MLSKYRSERTGEQPAADPCEPIPALSADPDQPLGHAPAPMTALHQQSFNPDIPNVARIYDMLPADASSKHTLSGGLSSV